MIFRHKTTGYELSSKHYDRLSEVEQRQYTPVYDIDVNQDILYEEEDQMLGELFSGNNDKQTIDCEDAD